MQVGTRLAVWYEVDGWMHISVDGNDLGPLLPHVDKVCSQNNIMFFGNKW